jgi:hypothetical protein
MAASRPSLFWASSSTSFDLVNVPCNPGESVTITSEEIPVPTTLTLAPNPQQHAPNPPLPIPSHLSTPSELFVERRYPHDGVRIGHVIKPGELFYERHPYGPFVEEKEEEMNIDG